MNNHPVGLEGIVRGHNLRSVNIQPVGFDTIAIDRMSSWMRSNVKANRNAFLGKNRARVSAEILTPEPAIVIFQLKQHVDMPLGQKCERRSVGLDRVRRKRPIYFD